MKRILCWVLSLLTAVSLCACAAADETQKIVLWHSMSDQAGAVLNRLIDEFNATVGHEAGVEAEAIFQGAYTDATTKMNNMLSANQTALLPDVMQLDATGKVNYALSGVAYTVDDALKDDPAFPIAELIEAASANWRFGGVQLGVPFASSDTVLYYNKTLLDEKSLSAPDTLADIAALAPAFADTGITVYADLPNTPSLANWLGQLGSYLVDQENGASGSATQLVCLENGALVQFLSAWKALYASGALKNGEGSLDAFAAGQVVCITASSSKIASLLEKIGGSFEMGVAAFPRVDENASKGSTASGSCLVMFDKNDESKKSAARVLVSYLVSSGVQAELAAATGYIPSNQASVKEASYQALIEAYPQHEVAFSQLVDTPAEMRSVTVGPSKDFYYAIQNYVSDMLTYDLSAEETAEEMGEELNGLLYQYNQANR